ncbi:MAG: glycosyltransferase family 9 protein [Planctomycetes bacterium]|nr:glycosyltransferase family 9 protein [Planctomycetota bacterium]
MFRRHLPPLHEVRATRIALIKPSALGDIVHTLPVLTALRKRFPEARISWFVNRSYEALIQGHPDLDETIPIDRQEMKRGVRHAVRAIFNLASRLRRGRFDLVLDLQGLLRSGLMSAVTGSSRRVGLSTAREGSRHFYTDLIHVPQGITEHAVERNWRVAEAFGVGHLPKEFKLPIASDAREWAFAELRDCPRPWLALGVGARWRTKRWPPDSFAVLAQRAQRHFGGTILFVGAPDETPLAKQVIDQLSGPTRDFTGKTSLPQLAALLEKSDAMVSNDTGPLHLAAALGRPVVAPYTCTSVSRHGPYGVSRGAVESSVWCQGSYIKRCDRMECMSELHPDRLWYFLNELLERWARHYRSA